MNQAQRNFLIKKIEDTAKKRKEALRDSIPKAPSLNNYLLHAVLSNNFEIKSTDELKEIIRKWALNSNEREDWLGNSWGNSSKDGVHFKAKEFFVIPEEYERLYNEYKEKREKAENEIYELNVQVDTLITRIQLASDKTLQTMINEVDDMGNLSLYDAKLKALTSGNENKNKELNQ